MPALGQVCIWALGHSSDHNRSVGPAFSEPTHGHLRAVQTRHAISSRRAPGAFPPRDRQPQLLPKPETTFPSPPWPCSPLSTWNEWKAGAGTTSSRSLSGLGWSWIRRLLWATHTVLPFPSGASICLRSLCLATDCKHRAGNAEPCLHAQPLHRTRGPVQAPERVDVWMKEQRNQQ